MKPINPLVHGYLDYFTVLVFIAAPSLFGMTGSAGFLAYALAAIHMSMTLITDSPLGARRVIPFAVHGQVEKMVGPVLLLAPFLFEFTGGAFVFYLLAGLVITIVGLLTDYGPHR